MSDQSDGLARLFRNPLSGLDASWRRALLSPAVSGLIAVLVAQLVAALMLASNAMQSTTADAPLLDLSSEQVTRIEISTDDEQVVLTRANDQWVLPALADFPADADKVEQLLSRLTALRRPLPVGSSSEAQHRLKVADDNAERRISLYGKAGELAQLLIGDSPGFRRLYGRLADEEAVYDLPLANFQVASNSDDWVKPDQLSEYDLEGLLELKPEQLMVGASDEQVDETGSHQTDEPFSDRRPRPLGATREMSESASDSTDQDAPSAGTKTRDGEQSAPTDAAPASETSSDTATKSQADAATEPTEEQPDFRPQQPSTRRAAPPQWPYQGYPPPTRQPWPQQGPPQGAAPQSAPGWR